MTFLDTVWIQSLLFVLHEAPTFAFDCFMAPHVWNQLPASLKMAWTETGHRFAVSDGMLDASVLTDKRDVATLESEGDGPWLIYNKVLSGQMDGFITEKKRG